MDVETCRPAWNDLPLAPAFRLEAQPTTRTPIRLAQSDPLDDLEGSVDSIVNDCFFTVGQVVGMRKTLDYEAVIWWRDHYRAKFLEAMSAFGDRWLTDRQNVRSVAVLLAERAIRYAGRAELINLSAAQKAAADIERYCKLHSRRHARAVGVATEEVERPLMAGYWCTC